MNSFPLCFLLFGPINPLKYKFCVSDSKPFFSASLPSSLITSAYWEPFFVCFCSTFILFAEALLMETKSHLLNPYSSRDQGRPLQKGVNQISRHLTPRQIDDEHIYLSIIKRKRKTKESDSESGMEMIILIGTPSIERSLQSSWHRESCTFWRCHYWPKTWAVHGDTAQPRL